jgi:hypothetical protein
MLQTWRHTPAPDPDFNRTVWAHIKSAPSAQSWSELFHFPGALPLAASLAIVCALAAGSGGAVALKRSMTSDRMATAYVRSIDPVQMTATASHIHQ